IFVELPTHIPQCHSLTYDPCSKASRWIVVSPVLRFGDRLPIEFKGQLGMAGLEYIGLKILVTRDAGIGTHIKTSQIAHPSGDTHGVSPIFSCMPAQPRFRGAVTTFAGHPFIR